EAVVVRVTVRAAGPGVLRDVLSIETSDPDAPEARVLLTAAPEDPCVSWEGSLDGVLDLGDVIVGRSESTELKLRNCSVLTTMRVRELRFTDPGGIFRIDDFAALADALPRAIAPGQSLSLDLTFAPDEVGPSTAQLQATTLLDGSRRVPLTILGAGTPNQCPLGAIDVREVADASASEALWSREAAVFSTLGSTLEFSSRRSRYLDGRLERAVWSVIERPLDSASELDTVTNRKRPRLTPDATGVYVVGLVVFDELGLESCVTERVTVEVVRDDDLVVELTWETPGDLDPNDLVSADLDLHLRHPSATKWEDEFYDVHWRNVSPDWGAEGDFSDNPTLLRDDRGRRRREVLVYNHIAPDLEYQIAVHVKNGANPFNLGPSIARVRVFSRGALLYHKERGEMYDDSFWAVGFFRWPAGKFFAQDLYYVELPDD
ncbi:MAG: hypothetical protein AAGI01_17075, partial [Myxococcota bacterium]